MVSKEKKLREPGRNLFNITDLDPRHNNTEYIVPVHEATRLSIAPFLLFFYVYRVYAAG